MTPTDLPILLLPHGVAAPGYATDMAAGADLVAAIVEPVALAPGARSLIPCGFCMALPLGFEAQVRPRSGLALKHGVTVLNTPGTIDADYRGEVKVILINLSTESFTIEPGARIAQMVVAPHARAAFRVTDALPGTVRGAGGFGSTGA